METNTGTIEKAGDCNDEKNYICEMPASTTSTFSIIHIEKVTLSTLESLSNSVFERRKSTGSGLFASLGDDLVETLG